MLWLLYGLDSVCTLYFFLHLFGVSTLHAYLIGMGQLVEATRAWAIGPVFAMESTYTTS